MPTKTTSRSAKLGTADDGSIILTLKERVNKKLKSVSYRLEPLPWEPGAWRLHRLTFSDETPVVYDLILKGKSSTCDCPGCTRWNHCKHIEGLLALQSAGKLNFSPED